MSVKYPFPVESFTCTNSFEFVVVPFPNCPYPLYPDAHTVPSDFSTTVWLFPDATSIAYIFCVLSDES